MSQPFSQLTPHLWVTQSQYAHTNSGVFLSGGQACLIDPGVLSAEIEAIACFVAEREAAPQAIILTSSHRDHVLGPAHFPGVQVVAEAHYEAAALAHSDGTQRWVANIDREHNIQRERPFVIPRPDMTYQETMSLAVGDTALHLTHAPGHSPDLSVVYHRESATLWAADMLSTWIIPFVVDSLAGYERTLATLVSWEIGVLVPGHGRPTADATEIQTILSEDMAYLAELRERVSKAVSEGKTVDETIASCAGMRLRDSEATNDWAHRLNVGQVYLELGGDADPTQVGWTKVLEETG